jgi:hypothetical protein
MPLAAFETAIPGSQQLQTYPITNVKTTKARRSCGKTLVPTYQASRFNDTEGHTTFDFTALKPDISYPIKGAVCLFRFMVYLITLTLD